MNVYVAPLQGPTALECFKIHPMVVNSTEWSWGKLSALPIYSQVTQAWSITEMLSVNVLHICITNATVAVNRLIHVPVCFLFMHGLHHFWSRHTRPEKIWQDMTRYNTKNVCGPFPWYFCGCVFYAMLITDDEYFALSNCSHKLCSNVHRGHCGSNQYTSNM